MTKISENRFEFIECHVAVNVGQIPTERNTRKFDL